MNRLAAYPALGLALGIASATLAFQDGAAAPAKPASAASAFDEAAKSADTVKKAEQRLAEVVKAYKAAPTLADTITIEVASPMGPQTEELALAFGKGTDMRLDVQGMKVTSLGGELFVEIDEVATDKFVGVPLKDGSIPKTLASVAEGFSLPLPHMAFRFGEGEGAAIEGMTVGSLQDLKVAGWRDAGDGNEQMLFEGANGTGVATIDSATGLLEGYEVDFRPPGAPEGMSFKIDFGFAPVVADELAKPITFEPGDRKRVATLDALMMKLQVGDPAPSFTLKTSTGEEVSLADLKGSVVVLDFWATWCGPCRKGLPIVNEFASWTREQSMPVKVFGVNVWEDQEKNAEKRTEQATKFWTDQKFAFPTLLDLTDEVASAYGPNGIPTTYIIDQEGRIAKIHTGFNEGMLDMLKEDVKKLVTVEG